MTTHVGRDLRRPEGPAKVTGQARYVADLAVEGAWVGAAIRSPVVCGTLTGIDIAPGFDLARVVLVRPEDIPGDNVMALIEDDQPILCARDVRHFGEPVALVAAPDRPTLAAALTAIRPRIVEGVPELDMERSQRVFKRIAIEKGDVDAAFARPPAGARVIEGTWRTDSQEQMYIEPQGCIAWPPDETGTVLVKGSLQCPHYVQKSLVRALGIAAEKARVVQTETGGGFGGKEEYPSVVACHAALLARAAGRPVEVIYERHEDLAVTPKRHPSRTRHRTLVDADGKLVAMDIDLVLDGGAYVTLSPVVLSRGTIHAAGPYRCANVRIRGRVVGTNHPPFGAFRGFGAPQTCFAYERQMDRIARTLGIHPVELRRRNLLRVGDSTATGQVLRSSVGSEQVLERALARTRFDEHPWCGIGRPGARPADGPGAFATGVARGVGMAFFFHGAGFTGSGETVLKGKVDVELTDDGRVRVYAGSTEIGQGTQTMFLALAAESLGAVEDDVEIAGVDTAQVPDSGPTVASRTCMVVGGCVTRACAELVQRIGGDRALPFRERARAFLAAARSGASGDPARRVRAAYESPAGLVWDEQRYRGDAYPVYGWACDVAEVEVDLDTFDVRVVRFTSAVDVGKAIQPMLVEGQIEGGSLQAIGFAHLEHHAYADGRFAQDRMATCVIPTSLDTPPFEVDLVEEPFEHGPFGAKGVGELPMDGGAPAVASAIEDALGIAVERVPATPERLLAAWLAAHPSAAATEGARA